MHMNLTPFLSVTLTAYFSPSYIMNDVWFLLRLIGMIVLMTIPSIHCNLPSSSSVNDLFVHVLSKGGVDRTEDWEVTTYLHLS